MKKIVLAVLLILLSFSCREKTTDITISKINNKEQENISDERENLPQSESRPLIKIEKDDILKIYVRSDGAPGMYLGEDGKLHGFYVELEKALMDEMDQKYELIPYDNLGPLLQKIKTGEAHSALAAPDLPEYRLFGNLSDRFEKVDIVTFVHETNAEIIGISKEEMIAALTGKKVGVQTRGHIYQTLRDYKDINIIEYPTTTQALEDLAAGNLDAVPDVKRIGMYYSKLNDWNIKPVGPAITEIYETTAFSKALDKSILERYNTALATLKENGTIDRLYKESFAEYLN